MIARLRAQDRQACPARSCSCRSTRTSRIGGRQSNAQYQYTLQAPDFATLARLGTEGSRRAFETAADRRRQFRSAGIRPVFECRDRPRYRLTPRTDRAGRRFRALRRLWPAPGVGDVQVDQSVSCGSGAQQQWWENPDFLNTIYVQTPSGTDVPLSTFAHFTQGITPISLPHQGQFPATTISFNLNGSPLSDAVLAINKAELEIGLPAIVTGQIRRHRAGVPGVAARSADPHRRRAAGGLHRTGHALREPDPSADDHLDAAFRRSRRADRARHVPIRT